MKRLLHLMIVVAGAAFAPNAGIARPAKKPEPVVVATAPSGAFHLEVTQAKGGRLSVVPTNAPTERQILTPSHFRLFQESDTPDKKPVYETVTTDKLEFLPLTFISPDDRWIYVAQNTSAESDEEDTIGYLYRRVAGTPDTAPRYEPATAERLDILAFRFVVSEEKIAAQHPGEPEEEGISTGSVHFVAWSPDSARLLIALDYNTGKFPDNVISAKWLCYYNTRTGAFERTERLRAADRVVLMPTDLPDHVIPGSVAEVLHAESVGQEGPFVPAKERFAKADTELNKVYQQLMKQLDPPAQRALRQEELDWLVNKETFAAIHADGSWSPFVEACNTDWRAVATEARVAELSRRLRP